jgi:hypothetical protein
MKKVLFSKSMIKYLAVALAVFVISVLSYSVLTDNKNEKKVEVNEESADTNKPRIIAPSDHSNITDIALNFQWWLLHNHLKYELQYSRNNDFSDATTINVEKSEEEFKRNSSFAFYLPQDLLGTGVWYWRVRADDASQNYEWSETTKFTINNDHTVKPAQLNISNDNPIFLAETFTRGGGLEGIANFVPEDIKNNFVLAVNRSAGKGNQFSIPLLTYLQPLIDKKVYHTIFYSGATNRMFILSELEELFQNNPYVVGVVLGEEFWAFNQPERWQQEEHIKRLIKLSGKYGKVLFWGDGNSSRFFNWQRILGDPEWKNILKQYAPYVNLVLKTNFTWKPYTSAGALFGAWLSGLMDHYGTWHEPWYWAHAGFGDGLGKQSNHDNSNNPKGFQNQPAIFWEQIFLNGLVQGASVYHIQGQNTIQGMYHPPLHANHPAIWDKYGNKTATWENYIYPFIKDTINKKLIPSKQQVLENVKVAVEQESMLKGNEDRKLWRDKGNPLYMYEYTFFDSLYRGTYGFDSKQDGIVMGPESEYPYRGGMDYEMIPNNTEYYFIPLLPYDVKALEDKTVIELKDLQDTNTVTSIFNKYYQKKFEGDAAVYVVGDMFTVMNSHENKDIIQNYKIPYDKGIIKNIKGKVGPHMYIIGKFMDNDTLWIKTNTHYKDRDTEIIIESVSKPNVMLPENATGNWNEANKTLTLTVKNTDHPTEIVIKK